MVFIKSNLTTTTTSIAFLVLLISLMGVCAFAELEKLPICDIDPLLYAFADCLSDYKMTMRQFDDFSPFTTKENCCIIVKYRICLDKKISKYCDKNEDRNAVLKLIQYTPEYLLRRINMYESLHCGSHNPQSSDCIPINETLKMILFAFAVLGSACICFCFGAGILYCTFLCVDWIMAKLLRSTPATNSIEMTTHEQEHP